MSKFKIEDFDTLEPSATPWLVKGLLPAVGVAFIAGPSMSGKSFLALDIAANVCLGRPVIGRKSTPRAVVYFASEAAAGVRGRIKGLRDHKSGPLGGRFEMIGQAPNLTDVGDVEDMRATIIEAKARMGARGVRLGLVVVDTLSASIPGADENTAKDMSPVLTMLVALADDFGLLILVIAHTSKADPTNLRGWSGLKNNSDGLILLVTAADGQTRVGKVDKVKEGENGEQFAFTLKQVKIGVDDDGDDITTCIVEAAVIPDAPQTKGRRATTKAGTHGDLILQAFNRFSPEVFIELMPTGATKPVRAVKLALLREEAFKQGLGEAEPNLDGCDDPATEKKLRRAWSGHRRKSFDRAREALISDRKVRQEGDLIWRLDPP